MEGNNVDDSDEEENEDRPPRERKAPRDNLLRRRLRGPLLSKRTKTSIRLHLPR